MAQHIALQPKQEIHVTNGCSCELCNQTSKVQSDDLKLDILLVSKGIKADW